MGKTASDYLVKRLHAWGIRRIFGYPGDGINGVMGALDRHKEKIEFIQTAHEEIAAFMACGHAKFTGEVGVCLATSGPGAIHLVNGLYDAQMDRQPVVAIVGQQARASLGAEYQQEVDLISLFKDVAHEYVHMASTAEQIRHLVDRAVRIAKAERTVTCIIIPQDVQESDAIEKPDRKHGSVFSGIGYSHPRIIPQEDDIKRAADVLNEGKRVAMLVGAGALKAAREVQQVAELLGAGVAKALLGKAALPDDVPYNVGSIGLLGTKPSWDMMTECDTLLWVGSGFPYSEFLPKEGKARGVQIDIRPRMLSARYPMEVNLHGDSALTLRALLPLLKQKNKDWQKDIEQSMKEWWEVMEARAMLEADPINPQRVFWELSPLLPDNCIITSDSGSAASWFARDLKIRHGMMASLSGNLATMCPALPYALAAKMAHSDRAVIATTGDGAMQMLGNAALINIARSWRSWKDPRLVVLVLNNQDLNQVTWEQRIMSGNPKFEASQEVEEFNYARYAEMLGLRGIEIDDPKQIRPAWEEAFRTDRPVVVDAHTDPDVPPLPPHITFEQAKGYMFSIFKGDPNSLAIIKMSAKEMKESFLHHGRSEAGFIGKVIKR
ncbi:MAG: thiamine pyrophosphate-requiring protein [Candidatus Abyssobacteria bacterium SURF_5]|uniref:Thiamine pyrophosphate-requiring protein n=1 Tax=Abyssobacteria bacterium (strain SURF_5) TaxID=2093360 RepID=A0A3A4MZI9_ABYX5|nr:MAG: thiamine pyrophosphate-requiring protein [Candidatus Abyssubacteria bacterium SURF_5]